ncbi:MAG: peptidase M4 [Phyllobacteriaceae bacterium]|nr:peptidase M4 [Phyllobacteriaceae bacterium]MBA93250.1 peptidase M4 [Phyllobacteriaceae bacterium]
MRAFRILIAGLLCALLAAAPALADRKGGRSDDDDRSARHERAAERRQEGELLPLADILKILHARFPGKVLEIEFEDDNPPVYEFYVLEPSGRVIEVEFDARTGRFLGQETDDD